MSQNQIPDVNFDQTGASEGGSFKYINIVLHKSGPKADQAELRIGSKDTGKFYPEFIGQFLGMQQPKFKQAEGDLPARHEYGIILRAKDSEDGQIKNFLLQLSSHWKSPIVSDIINPLAWLAAQPNPHRLVRFRVYAKKPAGKRAVMRCIVSDGHQPDSNKYMTCKYPWVGDKLDGKFDGVPEPTTLTDGSKDFSSIANFWHAEIVGIANKLGGGQDVAPAVPQTTTTTTAPAPPPPPPVATGTGTWADNGIRLIQDSFYKLPLDKQTSEAFFAKVKAGFKWLKEQPPAPTAEDLASLAAKCKDFAVERFFATGDDGKVFDANGNYDFAPGNSFGDEPPF